MRKQTEAGRRAIERRVREDEAPRLSEVVPALLDLSITIDERNEREPANDVSHIRRVVVASAPAMFDLQCCDRNCDGGHDLTARILRALEQQETEFEGSDVCGGQSKEGPCHFTLHYRAAASYRSDE